MGGARGPALHSQVDAYGGRGWGRRAGYLRRRVRTSAITARNSIAAMGTPLTGRPTSQPPPWSMPLLPPPSVPSNRLVPLPLALIVISGPTPPATVTLILPMAEPGAAGMKV